MNWTEKILKSNHTLIAGCSGSGKSVALNNILYEALLNVSNAYIMIDLKKVELIDYKELPQCLAYADTAEDAESILEKTVSLIARRYERMQELRQKKTSENNIYVVIDEYADLVLTCSKQTVNCIQRISQIGRAAGVHLIVCTQRPTREIIAGAISVNLETQLALRCSCAQDSRNIIGVSGAEKLPKYGKGILNHEGYKTMIDIPLISERDLRDRIEYIGRLTRELLSREKTA